MLRNRQLHICHLLGRAKILVMVNIKQKRQTDVSSKDSEVELQRIVFELLLYVKE